MDNTPNFYQRYLPLIGVLFLIFALGLSWRYTPLNQWLSIDFIINASDHYRGVWYGSLIVIATFVVSGFVAFPPTVLATVSIILFGPLLGSIYTLMGAAASAATSYAIGLFFGKRRIQQISGPTLNRLNEQLRKRGIWAVILVRIVPIAPFTLVNLVAGAIHIRLRDFLLGTVLGMAPGVISLALFADRIIAMAKNPSPLMLVLLLVVITIVAAILWRIRKYAKDSIEETPS